MSVYYKITDPETLEIAKKSLSDTARNQSAEKHILETLNVEEVLICNNRVIALKVPNAGMPKGWKKHNHTGYMIPSKRQSPSARLAKAFMNTISRRPLEELNKHLLSQLGVILHVNVYADCFSVRDEKKMYSIGIHVLDEYVLVSHGYENCDDVPGWEEISRKEFKALKEKGTLPTIIEWVDTPQEPTTIEGFVGDK